jgi:NAD(P) transhydrogenase subunit alpha
MTSAVTEQAQSLSTQLRSAAEVADQLSQSAMSMLVEQSHGATPFFVQGLTIFILAVFVGYYVVWRVTPALHSPLMAVTNAISAIVIVGAMLAAALTETVLGKSMGTLAVALAAVNVFGGFLVTRRMLEMFKKKAPKAPAEKH